jgi:hypothetical protein
MLVPVLATPVWRTRDRGRDEDSCHSGGPTRTRTGLESCVCGGEGTVRSKVQWDSEESSVVLDLDSRSFRGVHQLPSNSQTSLPSPPPIKTITRGVNFWRNPSRAQCQIPTSRQTVINYSAALSLSSAFLTCDTLLNPQPDLHSSGTRDQIHWRMKNSSRIRVPKSKRPHTHMPMLILSWLPII